MESSDQAPTPQRVRISLREYLGLTTIVMLAIGLVLTSRQLSTLQREVDRLRLETGFLAPSGPDEIAAARAPSDQPLTYRIRVRVPESETGFRVAYSSVWRKHDAAPDWFSALPVTAGESVVTIRVLEDPRDRTWKIALLVASAEGNRRMATVLPPEHAEVFRGSHDVLGSGVGRETLAIDGSKKIRILDERWLVGEGALLLYGSRPPERDQIGIYAELQPSIGPL